MTRTVPAVAVAAMLILTAFASVPVAAQESSVSVETEAPTNVTTDSATLNGDLTSMENATEATVWFEYWEVGDETNSTETENLTATEVGSFSIDVDGLESNTTYVVVARANADGATGVGTEVTFTTDAEEAVAVTTEDASAVTDSTATLNGELTELRGAESATVWFEYWEDGDRANNSTTPDFELDAPGAFSASIDGLANDTTHVFVAHAVTENVSATGDEVEFTTEAEDVLTVTTEEPTDVTNRSATFHGELTDLGDASSATVWFEYWEQDDPTNASNTSASTLDGPGAFSASVDDLDGGTTYVVQAHAETDDESAAGEAAQFTTEPDEQPLGVATLEPTNVTNTSATLNGELTGLGDEDTATVWFEYWVQGEPGESEESGEATLDAPGEFSADVTGLENDTTYVYVAHARTGGDTDVTGDEIEFTTGEVLDERPTWDGEGPFGRWLTSVLKNLVPPDSDVPFGQIVSDIVTSNNPGNGQGPPDHAGPPWADDDRDDEGDEEDNRGPPDHAGPPWADDDRDEEDDEDDGDVEFAVTVDGDIAAGENVTVTVTHDGTGVENATVTLNGEVVGSTDADGQLVVSLPDDLDDEVEIEAETEAGEGEWEHEIEADDD